MRRILVSPVARLVVPDFSTLSHNVHDFRTKSHEFEMRVLVSSTTFVGNISYYRKNSARYYHKYKKYSCNVAVILVRFE